MKTILLLGMGSVGKSILDILTFYTNQPIKILMAGRNEEQLIRRKNMIKQAALQIGGQKYIDHEIIDLRNIEDCAEKLALHQPEIIITAVCLQSWWVITGLPADIFSSLDKAGVGPWVPMHLTLIYNLIRAVKMSNIKTKVVNSSYPDVVNPALKTLGLAPFIGIGNVANPIPGIRYSFAKKMKCEVSDITVKFFAHHSVSYRISRKGSSCGIPYHLSVYLKGRNVSNTIDISNPFDLLPTEFRRLGGKEGQQMTAASAVSVLQALLSADKRHIHAPGPFGLPGGYAVCISEKDLTIDLSENLTLTQAIEVNEKGAYYDGIKAITNDGIIHFTDEHMQIMKEMLGYNISNFHVSETQYFAEELKKRYEHFVIKLSAHLESI